MIILLKYVLLGFIQGVTEALPISSSGHLLIAKNLLDVNADFDTLAIITNFGSLLAVIIVFRKDIIELINGFVKYIFEKNKNYSTEFKFSLLIVLGCIPAGIVGFIVNKLDLLNAFDENVKVVGVTLIITAIMLFLIRNFKGHKTEKEMTTLDAIKVGLFQIIGIFPGISRSGSTIVGGMFTGLKRDTAFKYSFLLYIPMSIAASLVEVKDLMGVKLSTNMYLYYGIATVTAFIFTLLVIKWFRKIVNNGKLIWFVYYCLIVGTLVILFL